MQPDTIEIRVDTLKPTTRRMIEDFKTQHEDKFLLTKRKRTTKLARSSWAARRLALRNKKKEIQRILHNLSLMGLTGYEENIFGDNQ